MPPTTKKKNAPSFNRRLTAFANRVRNTERSISRIRGTAERRAKAQIDSEEEVLRLERERDALRGTLDAVDVQRHAAAEERLAALNDLRTARREWSAIQKRARKLPAFRIATSAVVTVDGKIDKLRKKIAALETKIRSAESTAAEVKTARDAAEKARRDSQETMQRRPLEIRTARGELSRILADAKAADPEDVHAFAAADRRFQAAFDELRARTRASEDELARGLLDTAAIDRARARAEAQLKKLNALKTTLAEAQTTLQDLVDRREHDIRTRILRHRPVNP